MLNNSIVLIKDRQFLICIQFTLKEVIFYFIKYFLSDLFVF